MSAPDSIETFEMVRKHLIVFEWETFGDPRVIVDVRGAFRSFHV